MLSSASGLVAGASAPAADTTVLVHVLRPFWHGGDVVAAGSTLAVPVGLARDLITAKKAERAPEPASEPAAEPAGDTGAAPRRAKKEPDA